MRQLLAVIVLNCLVLLSCGHKDILITYENRTAMDLLVNVNNSGFEKVERGNTESIGHRLSDDKRYDADKTLEITVKTNEGQIVYHQEFSLEDLKARDNRIVLEGPLPEEPPPAPATAE